MENFNKIKEEITKLQTSFAAISKKYKEIDADMSEKDMDPKMMQKMMQDMMENMDARMGYVWSAIRSMDDSMYEHGKNLENHKNKNHVPPLSASQMQKLLDKTGLADDFSVERPVIYASKNGRKIEFIAEYKKPVK